MPGRQGQGYLIDPGVKLRTRLYRTILIRISRKRLDENKAKGYKFQNFTLVRCCCFFLLAYIFSPRLLQWSDHA